MKLRIAVAGVILGVSASTPAFAQGLSQWGMWGEGGTLRGSQPSFLGLPPPRPAPIALASGGSRPEIAPEAPEIVPFANGLAPGSIVIDTAGRRLYYTLSATEAYGYPVAVGKQGFTWTGIEKVSKIEDWPDWIPPAEMRQRMPSLPLRMTGGLRNPLGVKAIYLGKTLYRIHGTNDADSIGEAASSGCFRMHNKHVVHLAGLITPDTTVHVLKRLPKSGIVMQPETSDPARSGGQKI